MLTPWNRAASVRKIDGHRYFTVEHWPLPERETRHLNRAVNIQVDNVGLRTLEYLAPCAQMRRLIVTDPGVRDVSALDAHKEHLVELDLFVGTVTKPLLLPHLQRLAMQWQPRLSSLLETRDLRHLMLEKVDESGLLAISNLPSIETLDLRGVTSRLKPDLLPPNLRVLRLVNASVATVAGDTALPRSVKVLELDRVSGFSDLRPLRGLKELGRLVLEETGDHDYWDALLELPKLREVVIIGRNSMPAMVLSGLRERGTNVRLPPG